jgi:integrase
MAKGINRLKPLQVSRIKKSGRYSDGNGLYLYVGKTGGRSWAFLYTREGKARELGLGAVSDVSIADARAEAAELRGVLARGDDPKTYREQRRRLKEFEAARTKTFKACAEEYIAANRAGWRNPKHAQQWQNTLATYAEPHFGLKGVADVNVDVVKAALLPIWQSKPETASRVRGRIEAVLDFAKAHNYRQGENPARWKGGLEFILPPVSKVRRVEHHAALPYAEVPAFLMALGGREGVAALALRFLILTATRTSEALGARWNEIDLDVATWMIPASRMKAGREHRIPLSNEAVALLKALPRAGDYVFPGQRLRAPLSNMALLQALRRMNRGDLTAHGFRSSFRDWAAERTTYSREVIEASLAHTVGSKVEAAYLRSDLIEKRRYLMADWGRWCADLEDGDKVVPLRRA